MKRYIKFRDGHKILIGEFLNEGGNEFARKLYNVKVGNHKRWIYKNQILDNNYDMSRFDSITQALNYERIKRKLSS